MTENKDGSIRPSGPTNLTELRGKLDVFTDRITLRLGERLRFPQNPTVYEPNAVHIDGRSDMSLFEFAVEGLEEFHGKLGRFKYPDQFSVSGLEKSEPKVERKIGSTNLYPVEFGVGRDLLPFYRDVIAKHTQPGDDPNTYGETAYTDADLVVMMNERMHVGRYVAEVKGQNDPSIYEATENEEVLMSMLTDKKREDDVIDIVRQRSERYSVNPDLSEEVFRWMIEKTKDIEVAYIKEAAAHRNNPRQ